MRIDTPTNSNECGVGLLPASPGADAVACHVVGGGSAVRNKSPEAQISRVSGSGGDKNLEFAAKMGVEHAGVGKCLAAGRWITPSAIVTILN